MLNFGKKIHALRNKNNKYSNSCVVRKKNSERNKKPYPPPFKLNGRSLKYPKMKLFLSFFSGLNNFSKTSAQVNLKDPHV